MLRYIKIVWNEVCKGEIFSIIGEIERTASLGACLWARVCIGPTPVALLSLASVTRCCTLRTEYGSAWLVGMGPAAGELAEKVFARCMIKY